MMIQSISRQFRMLAAMAMSLTAASGVSAQTNIFNGVDVWATNAANWSQGVLPIGSTGYVVSAADGWLDTATGWTVIQTGGQLGVGGVGLGTTLSGDTDWTLDGGTLGDVNLTMSGTATVTLNSNGTLRAGSGRDFTMTDDAIVVAQGGSIEAGDTWWMRSSAIARGHASVTAASIQVTESAVLALTNSTINVSGSFGQRATSPAGGSIRLDACTLTADIYKVQTTGHRLTFAGEGEGSATFRDWQSVTANVDDEIFIDFLTGARMTMAMTNARSLVIPDGVTNTGIGWAEVLWDHDQLMFDGQTSTDLSMPWSAATNRNAFEDYQRFDFDGVTLSLVSDRPPPGTLIMLH